MKFFEIFKFELFYQLRRPSTWLYLLAVLGLLSLVIDELIQWVNIEREVFINAPIMIANLAVFINKFGLLLIAALVGDGAMRDIQSRMDPLVYSTSISKMTLLGGRFLGTTFISSAFLFLMLPLSVVIAKMMGAESASFGAFNIMSYVNPLIFIIIPNVIIATTILYAAVFFSRNSMAAYAAGLIVFILSHFSLGLAGRSWEFAMIIDPFGGTIIDFIDISLSPNQQNTTQISLNGNLAINRILWVSISSALALFSIYFFRFAHHTTRLVWKKNLTDMSAEEGKIIIPLKASRISTSFNFRTIFIQTGSMALQYFSEIIRSPLKWFLTLIALFTWVTVQLFNKGPLRFPIYPTTDRLTLIMSNTLFEIIATMLIIIVAGQLIWRERDTRISEISDAVPVSNWSLLISKFFTLLLLILVLQFSFLLVGISIQFIKGYNQFDIGLYLEVLFGIHFMNYILFVAAAMVIHVVINQKYVGHMLALLFYFYTIKPSLLGIEHNLLIYGSEPGQAFSAFYEESLITPRWIIFKLYWLGWASLLIIAAKLMWVRGKEGDFKLRLQQAIMKSKSSMLPILSGIIIIISMGSIIFYNTNILNEYNTHEDAIEKKVAFEQLYGAYKNIPQPHLTKSKLHVELYPEERKAYITGTYELKNSSHSNIDSIHFTLSKDVKTKIAGFSRKANVVVNDEKLDYAVIHLSEPLRPGENVSMNYEIIYEPQGFKNRGYNVSVMKNGSWIKSWEWLPKIGYQSSLEISDKNVREEYSLPAIQKPTVEEAVMGRSGREHINFAITLGTSLGQTAVAPGSLKKTWIENERQYFHYEADHPIKHQFYIYSAKYEKHEFKWNDKNLTIYYHPENAYNIKSFENSMKASLDYYTAHYSPYPLSQLSLVETPDPGIGGISLPGNIGYSTNFSLLNPEGDTRGFNLPFAVVAHEIAHQWWGTLQLTPAYTEGGYLISEGLAWFSAFGVIENTLGKDHVRNHIDAMKKDLLNPRSMADVPLLKSNDAFHGYRKGPFAMYALWEYIGEENANKALRSLLSKFEPGEPPFPTAMDMYKELQTVTPDSLDYLLIDLFEKNTFWELYTKAAELDSTKAGNWTIKMEVIARKIQVDTVGVITEIPMNDYVEIGILNAEGLKKPLYLRKQKIKTGSNIIEIELPFKPIKAGVDPRNLLIDTMMENNVILL